MSNKTTSYQKTMISMALVMTTMIIKRVGRIAMVVTTLMTKVRESTKMSCKMKEWQIGHFSVNSNNTSLKGNGVSKTEMSPFLCT